MDYKTFRNLVAEKSDHTKKETDEFIAAFLETIEKDVFANEDKVNFKGYFQLFGKTQAQRKARNPRTGDEVIVPERLKGGFKQSDKLTERLNQ